VCDSGNDLALFSVGEERESLSAMPAQNYLSGTMPTQLARYPAEAGCAVVLEGLIISVSWMISYLKGTVAGIQKRR